MHITDQTIYDGSFIHHRFAYKYFKDKVCPTGNIVSFVCPAQVDVGLIDLEDALARDFIFSDKMINFCWEIPCISDCFGAIAFQRLFNSHIANELHTHIHTPITIDGDDILVLVEENVFKKASVSITYHNDCAIGHTGINIIAGDKAPSFAYSTELSEEKTQEFINKVTAIFQMITADIFKATTKICVPR
jgi:hypothetical protein